MIDVAPPYIETTRIEDGEELLTIEVTPRASEQEIQAKLKRKVKRLLKKKENKLCLDCSKPNPRWATMLSVPSAQGGLDSAYAPTYFVGGFCCLECSGAHRRLGTHISFVRSTELDKLKEHEVKALEIGGNAVVNKIFEGSLFDTTQDDNGVKVGFAHATKPDSTSSQKTRETFIRSKYEKKKYLNIKALANFRQSMITRDMQSPRAQRSPISEIISPASTASQAPSPLQLQIFTSSPRTLKLIEKYMNPKPKKTGLKRMKFSFKQFSRKRQFKGSLANLRGVIGVNPNLNIVHTRSEDGCSSAGSDQEADEESVSSTKSSMSAVIRRKLVRDKKVGTPKKNSYSFTSTPRKDGLTPTPKGAGHTPTRKIFFQKKSQTSKEPDLTADETVKFDIKKDIFNPSPASSTESSRRLRLTHLLRTPKRRNASNSTPDKNSDRDQTKHNGGEVFFADESGLGPVKEIPSQESSEDKSNKREIKAMRAWSIRLDNVITRVFKIRKTPKMGGAGADEVTLLQEESQDSTY